MPKSIPRIGKQKILTGLKKLAEIVQFEVSLTEEELKERMREINEDSDTKIFKDAEEWLKFTKKSENRSVQIIRVNENSEVELTQEGKNLIDTSDFRGESFKLLERKAKKNFTHYEKVLTELDNKVKQKDYKIGDDLVQWIYMIIKNSVTAGAIACLLKDFEIVSEKNGIWEINPVEYSSLRGEKKDLAEDIVRDYGRIDLSELEKILKIDFEWSESEFEEVITKLENEGKISKDKFEGKYVVEALKQ